MSAKREEVAPAIKGGVVAGLMGGAVLVVLMMGANLVRGIDLWGAWKLAGAPFMHGRALQPGPAGTPVIVGLLSHFAVSVAWGVPFALLVYGLRKGRTVIAGLGLGVVSWLGMFYVVLPLLGLRDTARAIPIGTAIFEHVLFGVATALAFLLFQREHRYRSAAAREDASRSLWLRARSR